MRRSFGSDDFYRNLSMQFDLISHLTDMISAYYSDKTVKDDKKRCQQYGLQMVSLVQHFTIHIRIGTDVHVHSDVIFFFIAR